MGRRHLTIKEVKERIAKISPNIEILSNEYMDAKTKLQCRCKIDGHIWWVKWGHLSQGKGCPKCGGTMKLTIEEVTHKVSLKHPSIEVLSKSYTSSRSKLSCLCKTCNTKWLIRWDDLKQGHGCPECSKGSAWTLESWMKRAKLSSSFDSYKLYVLKCWNNEEEFYKIGITFLKLKERYWGSSSMPYNYIVLEEFEFECGDDAWKMEKALNNLYKEYHYKPKIKFGGSVKECFSLIPNLVNEVKTRKEGEIYGTR